MNFRGTIYFIKPFLYRLHDLHYACILTTIPFIIFEIIAWHAIYGGKTFLVLNSVYQVSFLEISRGLSLHLGLGITFNTDVTWGDYI